MGCVGLCHGALLALGAVFKNGAWEERSAVALGVGGSSAGSARALGRLVGAASSTASHGTYCWAALPFNGEPECEAVHAKKGALRRASAGLRCTAANPHVRPPTGPMPRSRQPASGPT
jgi:hypothetical protein